MQIEQRWVIPQTVLSKEIGNKKYDEENKKNLKNVKVSFRLNVGVRTCRKEKEDSRLNGLNAINKKKMRS